MAKRLATSQAIPELLSVPVSPLRIRHRPRRQAAVVVAEHIRAQNTGFGAPIAAEVARDAARPAARRFLVLGGGGLQLPFCDGTFPSMPALPETCPARPKFHRLFFYNKICDLFAIKKWIWAGFEPAIF